MQPDDAFVRQPIVVTDHMPLLSFMRENFSPTISWLFHKGNFVGPILVQSAAFHKTAELKFKKKITPFGTVAFCGPMLINGKITPNV